MESTFYWVTIRRFWWLIVLPLIVTVSALVLLDALRGQQYQTTIYVMVNGPYGLNSTDYPTLNPMANQNASAQIYSQLDFANAASSLQVAAKTIDDLHLPVHTATDLFMPPTFQLRPPSVQVILGDPEGDAKNAGLLTQILGTSGGARGNITASTRLVEIKALAYDPRTSDAIARDYAANAVAFYSEANAQTAELARQAVLQHAQAVQHQVSNVDQAYQNYQQLLQLAQNYQNLADDARMGSGVFVINNPYTEPVPSKLFLNVVFGALISVFFGLSLALLIGYIDYLNKQAARAQSAGSVEKPVNTLPAPGYRPVADPAVNFGTPPPATGG